MHDETSATITPSDLRAAIARSGVPNYVVAARARINPIRLSRLIRGREHLTEVLATRILRAVEHESLRREP
jgi:hypothetical protein